MEHIKLEDVEGVTFELARTFMEWGEPIPSFDSRYPNVLESCLATPFRKDLYATTTDKAAILFYLMVKNHPFENGNKRLAVATLLLFLYVNNEWLRTSVTEFYAFSKSVAESRAEEKETTVSNIGRFITNGLEKLTA